MKEYLQFINGSLVNSHSTDKIEVENPYTGEIMALAPQGDEADAMAALEAAKIAQDGWAARPAAERATALQKMAAVIRENRMNWPRSLPANRPRSCRLPRWKSISRLIISIITPAGQGFMRARLSKATAPRRTSCSIASPWASSQASAPGNFPFFVMARKVAPALLTGNTIVIKPSSEHQRQPGFAKLAAGLDLPAGILNIISGRGSTLGETLVRSPFTAMVTLTGSVEAGSKIIAATAENITKCSLELGGKAPAIVCADADLDLAVKRLWPHG